MDKNQRDRLSGIGRIKEKQTKREEKVKKVIKWQGQRTIERERKKKKKRKTEGEMKAKQAGGGG